MKTEFKLSEYRERDATGFVYPEEKVKELIKELDEGIDIITENGMVNVIVLKGLIQKRVGEELK